MRLQGLVGTETAKGVNSLSMPRTGLNSGPLAPRDGRTQLSPLAQRGPLPEPAGDDPHLARRGTPDGDGR